MTARLSGSSPQKRPVFAGWHYLLMASVFILLILFWFAFEKRQSSIEIPKVTSPTKKQPIPSLEIHRETKSSDGEKKSEPVKPLPQPLNLNLAPIETTDQMGPKRTLDEITEQPPTFDNSVTPTLQKPATDFLYDYKGRDEQGVQLELGTSKNATQIKFGVQVDEQKLNVNSIEVEVPLSK